MYSQQDNGYFKMSIFYYNIPSIGRLVFQGSSNENFIFISDDDVRKKESGVISKAQHWCM